MMEIKPQTRAEQLEELSGEVLRDLARNESASREVRKAAVEMLMERNHPQAKHPELSLYVMEINAEKAAKSEVQAIVESQVGHEENSENEPALTIEYSGFQNVEKSEKEKILHDAVEMYFGHQEDGA